MADGLHHRSFSKLWLCAGGSLLVHSGLLWLGVSLRAVQSSSEPAAGTPLSVELVDPIPADPGPPPAEAPAELAVEPDTVLESPPAVPPTPEISAQSEPDVQTNPTEASSSRFSEPISEPIEPSELPLLTPDAVVTPPPEETPSAAQPPTAEASEPEELEPENSAPSPPPDPEAIADPDASDSSNPDASTPDTSTPEQPNAPADLPTVALPGPQNEPKTYLASLTLNPVPPTEADNLDQLPYPLETQRVFEADPRTTVCSPTPESLRRLGDTVSIRVMVEPDGRVIPWAILDPASLNDADGPSPLTTDDQSYEQLAACVLEEWTFEPALMNGVPVPSDRLIISIQLSPLES